MKRLLPLGALALSACVATVALRVKNETPEAQHIQAAARDEKSGATEEFDLGDVAPATERTVMFRTGRPVGLTVSAKGATSGQVQSENHTIDNSYPEPVELRFKVAATDGGVAAAHPEAADAGP